jgi:hypothetical protein
MLFKYFEWVDFVYSYDYICEPCSNSGFLRMLVQQSATPHRYICTIWQI